MDNSNLKSLPIFKHFEDSDISKNITSWRKGEKGLNFFIKLAAAGAVGYGLWVYVLPVVFQAIGQFLAVATTGILLLGLIIAMPVILKGIRVLTRNLHKAIIKHDPFAELYHQRDLMYQNKQKFQQAKGKILNLKNEMEIEADKSEKTAKKLQTDVVSIQAKAQKLKDQLDDMVKTGGPAAKGTDEYVNTDSEFRKLLSDSARISNKLTQETEFIQKYGTRANIMKKFSHKLIMVETTMDIKVSDFDATIEILKKDYDFAQKSRQATESAKSAMMFTKTWELEYALDVVTSTIAQDIAITSGNLNDIDSLTAQYALNGDSDTLYANLDVLANDIKTGSYELPDAKQYSNPEYQLTHQDKLKSGGFNDIF